jgi:hypothetical protein
LVIPGSSPSRLETAPGRRETLLIAIAKARECLRDSLDPEGSTAALITIHWCCHPPSPPA